VPPCRISRPERVLVPFLHHNALALIVAQLELHDASARSWRGRREADEVLARFIRALIFPTWGRTSSTGI
jgi:hypothetical protein